MAKQWENAPEMQIDPKKKYEARMKTDKGTMVIELFADKAPKTVNNFVFLAREGFYDGLIFHRVINDFMVQGGDPTGTSRRITYGYDQPKRRSLLSVQLSSPVRASGSAAGE